MRIKFILLTVLFLLLCTSCNSKKAKDLLDVAQGVDRKPINKSITGVNVFLNNSFAGNICDQLSDIHSNLQIGFIRVLFNWDDNVQDGPKAALNFSFYDDIVGCIPDGVSALAILTNVPSWFSKASNREQNNPRLEFVNKWVEPVVSRYSGNNKIVGYQIWNEPNNADFSENNVMDVRKDPLNFLELVSLAFDRIKGIDSSKVVVNGATTSIAQNFPSTLDYNKALKEGGIENVVDRFAIHYYGTNYEVLVTDVKGFLKSFDKPIWVTESGKQGMTEQLEYVERTWPFLTQHIPNLERFYYYRYAESEAPAVSFGLRNPSGEQPVSDLYVYLRDN